MKIDVLLERYRNLRLTYFRHRKVTPWEKREKEASVNAFMNDLNAYLLKNHWTAGNHNGRIRVYQYEKDSSLFLKIKNSIDYFGVHTVFLIEIYLIRKRRMLWDRTLADGELVFDYLKRMT